MLHNVRMIQRRFPRHARRIEVGIVAASLTALALGLGVFLLG